MKLSAKMTSVKAYMDKIAPEREKWIRRNRYYYQDLLKMLRYNIPENRNILEIGCGTGYILNALKPRLGVGIDISPKMLEQAKKKYPHLKFINMDAGRLTFKEKYDYIIITDTLGYIEDIQQVFKELKKIVHPDTRVIITAHSFLWTPCLSLAELLHLKMPVIRLNWLSTNDVANLLHLEGFEIIKTGRRMLCPKYIPVVSGLMNKYLVHLPLLNRWGLTGYIISRPPAIKKRYSVSVIIPARNEKGNIETAMRKMPRLGKHTEVIFVEGHSTDDTLEEIRRVCRKYKKQWDVKYLQQDGKGKGDAVRKGFQYAQGEILMILDADLTVPPEDLVKFYQAMAAGKGEYINGTRLVYPMEKQAMRLLNYLGNHFFSMLFSWLLGQRLKDTLCGTKVLSRKNYARLTSNRAYFGEFDPFGDFDLIFGSAKLNLKIIEVPIRYQARSYGHTNISRFRHGWLLLKMSGVAMHKLKFI